MHESYQIRLRSTSRSFSKIDVVLNAFADDTYQQILRMLTAGQRSAASWPWNEACNGDKRGATVSTYILLNLYSIHRCESRGVISRKQDIPANDFVKALILLSFIFDPI